ncbi:response regulator transcription factor [Oxalobacteraceae bacterium]|nr:response regulator transcription factor [Oxalobacteraceae bacterium]
MAIGKRERVFIVDDNALTRTLLRMMIQGDRYEVVGDAASAEKTMERLPALRPDIVCLDVMLPDSDGLALLRRICTALPACAVLMVTARNDRNTVETAMRDGAKGFIIKPFNPGTVLDALDQVVANLASR